MYSNNREIELNRSDACFDQILTRNVQIQGGREAESAPG